MIVRPTLHVSYLAFINVKTEKDKHTNLTAKDI